MEKRNWKLAGVFLLLLLLASLVAGCGKKEEYTKDGYAKKLYLYNWSEYMPQEVMDLFEKEYGIKVVQSTYESNDELLAKLVAGKKGAYDLAIPSNFYVNALKQNGLLEPYDQGALKNIGNIDPAYLSGEYDPNNEYTVPYQGTLSLAIGNKKMLSDLGVTVNKVDDLMNPALKDNVILMDDNEGIVSLGLEGLGYDPLTKDKNQIAETKDYLIKLGKNLKAIPSTSDGRSMLARGEAAVGYIYSGDAAQAMAENPDLEIVMKEEPISLSVDCLVLLKGSKHKKEAELFVDFLLRPDISAKITTEYQYLCVNNAAKADLSQDILNNPACFLPDELKNKLYFVKERDADVLSQMVDIVTELKASK